MTLKFNFRTKEEVPRLGGEKQRLEEAAQIKAIGPTVRTGKDGARPMTLAVWIDRQLSETPHPFEVNAGGGAASTGSGRAGGGNRTVRNPFRKETRNQTGQMRLQRSDPGLAARLAASA